MFVAFILGLYMTYLNDRKRLAQALAATNFDPCSDSSRTQGLFACILRCAFAIGMRPTQIVQGLGFTEDEVDRWTGWGEVSASPSNEAQRRIVTRIKAIAGVQ